ncbi:MAG TPA: BTAD domain-containing putative transcriptional regulator [Acidimicrobiia bacterium]
MLFRILGEVSVVGDDGEVICVGARKQRALLALLVFNANRVVARSVVVDALWADALPLDPKSALQVVVSRLRAALGSHGSRVVAEAGGYRLDAGPEEVDFLQAESLLGDGRLALANSEGARAADAFDRALSLWTGDALQDLEDFSFSLTAAQHLHDLRMMLVEARNNAFLADGHHLQVLADVDSWVAVEPFREHLRAQQIAALYRAGRQGDALRACESLRKALRDELGLEPSAQIQDLERRVLDQDPSLVATDAGFMTPLPAWTAESLTFIGREAECKQVLARLAEAVDGDTRFVLVEGDAGIGKSRLLVHIARLVARDAIVLPIHIHDVFSPALHTVARVVAEATLGLSDDELSVVARNLAGVAPDVATMREVASALVAGDPMDGLYRDEDVLRDAARWIAALSAKAPVVLMFDDLDGASTSVLHVIGQLATLSMPKRVLVVASVRSHFERSSAPVARMTETLERLGLVDRIALGPLNGSDIDDLLERMHVAPRAELARRLHELTAGNPLLLAELLSIGPPERVVGEWSSPPRIRDIVRKRTAELGRATSEILKHAALFENDFTVELLAETTGTSTGTTATLIDRAVDAHVLQPSTIHSYRFAHQLFRDALVADLSAGQRADGHRRIACSLERRESSPELLAAHWSAASGPDVGPKVMSYARVAGRESLQMFEPSAAVRWFELALAYLSDDADRGSLLAELAEAQQFAGDPRCIATLQEAVGIALANSDDELTLEIVRVTTPGWSTFPGVTGADTRQLLARALEIVDDAATRSRVLTRLAIDLSLRDAVGAERAADESVALARESGDRTALLESLLRRASFSLTPQSLAARRSVLREVLDLSSRATDLATRYFALSASVISAIQAGDLAEADISAAEGDTIAASYDLAPLRWSSLLRGAWRAGLQGRLERAEELIDEACEFGQAHGISHAPESARLQRAALRWQQGRTAELLPAARAACDTYAAGFPGIALLLARVLAEHEMFHGEARALLSRIAENNFAGLPPGTFWSSALVVSAETGRILEMPEVCRTIRDLLMPFADQVAFMGVWVTAPIAYGVGMAAIGCGDRRAPQFLEQAAEIAEGLHAPILAARARSARAGIM